jgi:hypothetical protein
MDVYRPVLDYLLSNPAPLAWIMGATFVVGFRRWEFAGCLSVRCSWG